MKKPESVLQTLTRGGSFCCEHAFLHSIGVAGQHIMNSREVCEIAERVGVSISTINRWNGKVRYKRIIPCSVCVARAASEKPARILGLPLPLAGEDTDSPPPKAPGSSRDPGETE